MKVDCNIMKESFKNEQGENIEFISYKIEIDGESFSLFPRKEDKRLIAHILGDMPEFKTAPNKQT